MKSFGIETRKTPSKKIPEINAVKKNLFADKAGNIFEAKMS